MLGTTPTTREDVKNRLVQIVESGPIKGTEIASDYSLINMIKESNLDVDIPILLNELVEQKRVIEIEYVLPKVDYRIKSIYMPLGAEIVIRGGAVD